MNLMFRPKIFWGAAVLTFIALVLGAHVVQRKNFRQAVVAIQTQDAAIVSHISRMEPADFWERAKAMGVAAAALRQQTLGGLAQTGQVLIFSKGELAKWKTLGLITPNAGLKPSVVWVKDRKLAARLAGLLRNQGLLIGTSTASGYSLLELAQDAEPTLAAGFDPEDLEPAAAAGLQSAVLSQEKEALFLDVSAPEPAWLRAAYGRPERLLVARLDLSRSADENLSSLRGRLRSLRERGILGGDLPEESGSEASFWRLWLAWFLAVLGPIFSVRAGVRAFQWGREEVLKRRPVASPVAETLFGVLVLAMAASALGLIVGLLLSGSSAAALPQGPTFSTMAWPLAIGALALYPVAARFFWSKRAASPTYADLFLAALLVAAGILLFEPRLLLADTPVWRWVQTAMNRCEIFWWWPWRWREIFLGLPAFVVALGLVVGRGSAGFFADPRPWLWLGLLFPIGIIAALGRPGICVGMILSQTAVVSAAGLLLGFMGRMLGRMPEK